MGKININLKEILIFVCILIFMYIIYRFVTYYKYRSIRNNEVVDDDDDEVHDESTVPGNCDPKATPPELCPGGISCPQCGKPACPCPPKPPPGPPPGPGPGPPGSRNKPLYSSKYYFDKKYNLCIPISSDKVKSGSGINYYLNITDCNSDNPSTIIDCDVSKLSESDKLECINNSNNNDNYYMGKAGDNTTPQFIKENASKDTLKNYKDLCKVEGCFPCTCANGNPTYGPICKTSPNKFKKCASCNDGYNLVGDDCVLNKCTCPNGTVKNNICDIDGSENCEKCNTGYELKDNKCEKIPSNCNDKEATFCGGPTGIMDEHECTNSKMKHGGKWYDCRWVKDVSIFETHCQKSESPCG
jgi:hypothetical protein